MSMAAVGHKPRVTLETSAGAIYDIPTYDLDGNPGPINLQPIDPFDQINIVGDTAKALDRRVNRIIPAIQTGGAGRDHYVETEGVTDFRMSDADTRHEGVIVCRGKRISYPAIPLTSDGQRVYYAGYTGATLHTLGRGRILYYWDGAAWTACTGAINNLYGYCRHMGFTFVAEGALTLGAPDIYRSVDGKAFVRLGPALTFTNWSNTPNLFGVVLHDNKLWTVSVDTANATGYLYACVNPFVAAAGTATWTLVTTFSCPEEVGDLFVWKDGSGSPALFIATPYRLLVYNPVGVTVETYDEYPENNPDGTVPFAGTAVGIFGLHFRSTGDLYLGQGVNVDYLMRYSPGAGFAKVTPNRYGGLPLSHQGALRAAAQNAYGIGVWTEGTATVGGVGKGAGWFLDPQGGWHCMDRDVAGSVYPIGGGIGNKKYYTVWSDKTVTEQDLPNTSNKPQFAVGRKYEINTNHVHNYAETDFGTEGSRFALLGFDLVTMKSDGSGLYGLDAAASVGVDYKVNGGAWTPVTQFRGSNAAGLPTTLTGNVVTAAQTLMGFPVRLVIDNEFGVAAYKVEWRVTLRTTNEDQTPVLVYCAPRGVKTPLPHYTYEFVVDATDFRNKASMAGGGVLGLPGGRSAGGLHKSLETLDQLSNVVKLTYGVLGQTRSDMCEFAMAPQLHPQAGVGRYRVSLRSVASDPSG